MAASSGMIADELQNQMSALVSRYGREACLKALNEVATSSSSTANIHGEEEHLDGCVRQDGASATRKRSTGLVRSHSSGSTSSLLLATSWSLTEALLDASFDACFVADAFGTILRVNRAALVLFGYQDAPEELVGNGEGDTSSSSTTIGVNISKVIGGPSASRHYRHFDEIRAEEKENNSSKIASLDRILNTMRDVLGKRRDGTEFPVQVGIRKLSHSSNTAAATSTKNQPAFVAYCHDLSRHKQQLAKIEEKKEHVEQQLYLVDRILDACFDAVVLIDGKGIITKVNRVTLQEFGYESEEELVGQNVSQLVGGGVAPNHDGYLKRFQRKGGTSTVFGKLRRVLARRKDHTEFPCQIGVRNLQSQNVMVGFIRNITHELEAMELAIEKRAAEELLLNMLPEPIAARLKKEPSGHHIADSFTTATILFADIVGFTKLSSELEPIAVVALLNDLFSRFDELLERYGLNKVKTIGDCYMVTSIPSPRHPQKSCAAVCHFGLDLLEELKRYNAQQEAASKGIGRKLNVRVGINTGSVVAGVVGKKRYLYDVWGHAVNLASRMESTGVPGKVQISSEVVKCLSDPTWMSESFSDVPHVENEYGQEFVMEKRGLVQVKGIGEVETSFLLSRSENSQTLYEASIRELDFNHSPAATGKQGKEDGQGHRKSEKSRNGMTRRASQTFEVLQSAEEMQELMDLAGDY